MTTLDKKQYLERCRQARHDFHWRGICIGEWAREHGFCPQTVYDVISGRLLGTRGEAHRVAVTLGIKEGAI